MLASLERIERRSSGELDPVGAALRETLIKAGTKF